MIERTLNAGKIRDALAAYSSDIVLDAGAWVACPDNVLLEEDDSLGLFEKAGEGVYTGHYFFKIRGKDAKDLAIRMLRWMFETAEVIKGLTPKEHKAAVGMTRNLGFKSYGEVDHPSGTCIIFVMTRSEFNTLHGNI